MSDTDASDIHMVSDGMAVNITAKHNRKLLGALAATAAVVLVFLILIMAQVGVLEARLKPAPCARITGAQLADGERGVSTHVLDVAAGLPGSNITVTLYKKGSNGAYAVVGSGATGSDGRADLMAASQMSANTTYKLHFALEAYFAATGTPVVFPEAEVVFRVGGAVEHYHMPLLLSPGGYTTYRGS